MNQFSTGIETMPQISRNQTKSSDFCMNEENEDFVKVRRKQSYTVYTRVQVERVYKSNPIFEAKNTTFLEKV